MTFSFVLLQFKLHCSFVELSRFQFPSTGPPNPSADGASLFAFSSSRSSSSSSSSVLPRFPPAGSAAIQPTVAAYPGSPEILPGRSTKARGQGSKVDLQFGRGIIIHERRAVLNSETLAQPNSRKVRDHALFQYSLHMFRCDLILYSLQILLHNNPKL